MRLSIISIIRKLAPPNSPIDIFYEEGGASQQISGVLIEVCDDGFVLRADGTIRFIRADIVRRFNIPESVVETPTEDHLAVTAEPSLSEIQPSLGESPAPTKALEEAIVVDPDANSVFKVKQEQSEPVEATFVLFSGPIVTPLFEPDFSVSALKRDDQLELVRWKNR